MIDLFMADWFQAIVIFLLVIHAAWMHGKILKHQDRWNLVDAAWKAKDAK